MNSEPRDLREAFLIAEAETLRRRLEDERDFWAEMSGIDNGKIARFLSGIEREKRRDDRKGTASARSQREDLTRLQILLASNSAYAQLYHETFDALREAEDATDRAILKAQTALEEARRRFEDTLDRAATTPDGTRVFRDKWGQVWTEHDERLSEADSANIAWRSSYPGYEAFVEDREAVHHSLTRLEALQGYRVDTLGRIRDRLMDEDDPPSAEELEQHRREMWERMPEEVRADLKGSTAFDAPAPKAVIAQIPSF